MTSVSVEMVTSAGAGRHGDLDTPRRQHEFELGVTACNQSVYGHEELPYTHNCVIPYTLLDHSWTPYHQTVYGYIHPVVVTATIITNCLVCAVLVRPSMRSATSTLLVAMAVSDTLTGLLPTPCFLVFYGFGLYVPP